MKIVTTIAELRSLVRQARMQGESIGFVPTMGYLHEGHIALIRRARQECGLVVASIFVNPLQFGPSEDFESYPRDLEHDAGILADHQCDLLFAPSVDEMYPVPMETQVELSAMGKVLCGNSRPTHFRGVTTVVSKLFNIVQPDRAYFGQKDGQQAALIRRMVQDLSMPVHVVTVPTVREPDGLAKSSRNVYLSQDQRRQATILYKALSRGLEMLVAGERSGAAITAEMKRVIASVPEARLDYAEVVYLNNLTEASRIEGQVMLAVAVYFGKARLIDNFQLDVSPHQVVQLYERETEPCLQ